MAQSVDEMIIPYNDGHACFANGVGDFTFICPWHGKRPGFVPFFQAFMLRGTCLCGLKIEPPSQEVVDKILG